MSAWRRFARFNVVGLAGVGLQLSLVAVLVHGGADYRLASVAALMVTLMHNFGWHARWTWGDRPPARGRLAVAFGRFVASNGLVSLSGAAGLVPVLVDGAGLPAVPANLVSIAACGCLNFWIAGRACFEKPGRA